MKYTVEEVRDYADACRLAHKGPVIADMLTELAERIKVDESAAPVGFVMEATATRHKFGLLTQDLPPGAELFTHPPAQAAQVEESPMFAISRSMHSYYTRDPEEARQAAFDGAQVREIITGAPTAEPVAQGESAWLERLKDPATVHALMLRGVIAVPSVRSMVDLRGEVPNGEDVQLLRIAELQEQLAAQPAQSVDVAKVRGVIAEIRRCAGNNNAKFHLTWADKLEAALPEKGNG